MTYGSPSDNTSGFDLDPDRYPDVCAFLEVDGGEFRRRLRELEEFGQAPGTPSEVARAVIVSVKVLSELYKAKQG